MRVRQGQGDAALPIYKRVPSKEQEDSQGESYHPFVIWDFLKG